MYELGSALYDRRRWVAAAWAVALIAGLAFAPMLAPRLKSGGFDIGAVDSRLAADVLAAEFDYNAIAPILVFSSDTLTVDDPAYRQAVQDVTESLLSLPFVDGVRSYLNTGPAGMISSDRRITFAVVQSVLDLDQLENRQDEMKSAIPDVPVRVLLTGTPAVYDSINQVSEADVRRAELVTFPFALIVLLLVFGSLVAAGLPLLLAGTSVVITMALLVPLSAATDLSVFVLNTATLLGLGVAIDYSLFIVSRFREELKTRTVRQAVAETEATAGRAVLFSGLTVVIAMSGLLILPFASMRSIGMGGMAVVAVSVLAAVTLLPALLAMLGNRVNAIRVLPARISSGQSWARLAGLVMRHPIPVFLAVTAFLLFLGSPLLAIRFGVPEADMLPERMEARVGLEILQREFAAATTPAVVVTLTDPAGILRPENALPLIDFFDFLLKRDEIRAETTFAGLGETNRSEVLAMVFSIPREQLPPPIRAAIDSVATDGTLALRLSSDLTNNDPALRRLVEDIRAYELPDRFEVHVGGAAASFVDFVDKLYDQFPKSVLLVLAITYLVLIFLFRSVVLPAKAVIMNLLSLSAAYGALVYVFQQGHLSGVLGFTSQGYVEATVPVLLFGLLFGLSMDYEIFLLTRIREEYELSSDNTAAVAAGLARTGGIITGVAAIFVVVAGSFTLADIVIVKALGVGMAVAIAVDATVVRGLLAPATMRLLGRWNWWAPRPLRRQAVGAVREPPLD